LDLLISSSSSSSSSVLLLFFSYYFLFLTFLILPITENRQISFFLIHIYFRQRSGVRRMVPQPFIINLNSLKAGLVGGEHTYLFFLKLHAGLHSLFLLFNWLTVDTLFFIFNSQFYFLTDIVLFSQVSTYFFCFLFFLAKPATPSFFLSFFLFNIFL